MPSRAVVFLSDAHLGAESREREATREALLLGFLDSLSSRASELYILGDLFDFWFEYRTVIPRRPFHVLSALSQLRRAGIPITYIGGNHDFWVGPFLRDEIGLRLHDGSLALNIQGRRLWIHHGDGLIGGDLGYKVLKKILRNPLCIALYRMIHPDLGIPFAGWVSGTSRHSRDQRPLDGPRLVREIARPLFDEGFDAVMVGHFHHIFHHREEGRDFVVLGDWIQRFTYAVLEDGVLRVERWTEAGASPL
jgi:UDP-2,3-diacylglucosamine hydrolase